MDVSGGIDLRSYNGYHVTRVYDLLGGAYTTDFANKNQPAIIPNDDSNAPYAIKRKGDIIKRNYDGLVRWGAGFAHFEYPITVAVGQRNQRFSTSDLLLGRGRARRRAILEDVS